MSSLGLPRSATPPWRVPRYAGSGYWYPGKPRENPDVKERVIVPRLVPMYHVLRMIMLGAGPSHFLERSQPWNGPAPSGPQYTDPEQCAAPRTGSPGAFSSLARARPLAASVRQRPPLHLPQEQPPNQPLPRSPACPFGTTSCAPPTHAPQDRLVSGSWLARPLPSDMIGR